jgi:hypothetical protein
VVPAPGSSTAAANKDYVDDTVAALDDTYATLINSDGDPGRTIYVGETDPDIAYDLLAGDVWLQPSVLADIATQTDLEGYAVKIAPGRTKSTTVTTVTPGAPAMSAATATFGNNNLYYERFVVPTTIVIDQWLAEVVTPASAGNKMRWAIYAADTDWQPTGAPVLASAEAAIDSATVVSESIADLTLQPGRYLKRVHCQATVSLRVYRCFPVGGGIDPSLGSSPFVVQFRKSLVYGAAETPGTPWDVLGTGATAGEQQALLLRVKTP